MVAFPGTAMMLAIIGLNLLGDTVNDLLDPRIQRVSNRCHSSGAALPLPGESQLASPWRD
jgi:hypothetical protein